ncbi:MAG TPA: hypothetical protein VLV81_02555 [Acidimicrobiia bacterium]|nr:hypothetical protein [Acidimicrobiia bacterium]
MSTDHLELADPDADPLPLSGRGRRWEPGRLLAWVFAASVAFAVLPVVVAVGRAINAGWTPLSDDALFPIRARDVFSYHHVPLIGLDSSVSLTTSTTLHHPGPLQFDLLAVPVKLFGGAAGTALGTGLINVAAILAIAIFTARRGGPVLGTVVMAVTAALCWTMGSESLFEPWQPLALLLPFLCFLVLAWSVSCGDVVALPVAAGVGSLVFQTHVSYALLVPVLSLWAVGGLVLRLRRDRRDDGAAWPTTWRRTVRAVTLAAAVAVLCWVQPAIDQLFGQGNFGQLLQNASPPKRTIGYGYGARIAAAVLALPPFWWRPSMNETLNPLKGWTPPSTAETVLSLTVLAAVLGACFWLAHRRRDPVMTRALGVVGVAIVAGFATAGRIPITAFGLEAHVFWWLWPLAAFGTFVVAATLLRAVARRPGASLLAAFAATVAAAVFAALAVPTMAVGSSPNGREDAIPTTRAIDRQLGRLAGRGPILVDPLLKSRLADPYGLAIIAELQRRGIPFVAKDAQLVGQLGRARQYDGHNARAELFLRVGNDPVTAPPGTPLVARHDGLDGRERREMASLQQSIVAYINDGHLHLNRRGIQALAPHGGVPPLNLTDATSLLRGGQLIDLVNHGYLDLDPGWDRRFHRYVQLAGLADIHTVELYLAALPSGGRGTAVGRSPAR